MCNIWEQQGELLHEIYQGPFKFYGFVINISANVARGGSRTFYGFEININASVESIHREEETSHN